MLARFLDETVETTASKGVANWAGACLRRRGRSRGRMQRYWGEGRVQLDRAERPGGVHLRCERRYAAGPRSKQRGSSGSQRVR